MSAVQRRIVPAAHWAKVSETTWVLLEKGQPTLIKTKAEDTNHAMSLVATFLGKPLAYGTKWVVSGDWRIFKVEAT